MPDLKLRTVSGAPTDLLSATDAALLLGTTLIMSVAPASPRRALRHRRAPRKGGGLRQLGAAVRHNMIAAALRERKLSEGQAHIRSAVKLYGAKDASLFRLANDAAGFWSAFGFFTSSLPPYEIALPRVTRPAERAAVLANIARAAAATGDRDRFLDASDEVLSNERAAGEYLPALYLELAKGAYALGFSSRAVQLAR